MARGAQNSVLAFQVAGSGPTDGFYRYQGAQLVDGTHKSTLDVGKGSEFSYKFFIDPTWLIDANKQASGVWAVMQNAAGNAQGGGYYSIAEYVDPQQAAALKAAATSSAPAPIVDGGGDFSGGFRFWNSEQGWTKYVNTNATGWVDISFNMGTIGHAWSIKQGSAQIAAYIDGNSTSFANAAKLQTLIVDSQNFGQNQSYFYDDIMFKGTTYSTRGTELVAGALDGSYLWVGSGSQKTGFATVDTSQVQLALSVRERLNPISIEGQLQSDGKVHFNYTPEHDQSRFAYSIATLGNVKLGDLDFKLQIDIDPSAAATYRTFLLRPDQNAVNGAQPSGFEWVLDRDNNGVINDADKFSGQFVVITDDEGNLSAGQVTQNVQNIAWYDDNLMSNVLTKGTYDVRLQAFDKGGTAVKVENHIVVNVAGGAAPVDNGGGNNGGGNNGGGGTPTPNTPTPTPNVPGQPFVPPVVVDPSPNDGFNEAKAAASIATFFTGAAPTPAKQAELNVFANLQFEAYKKAGVANPAMGPYEALGRGFAETVEFSQKYAALTEAEFITARYVEVFGRDPSAAQQAHFQAQIDYFELIYENAGISSARADLFAKGAVLGQMIGHAALDPVVTTQASTSYAWDLAA